MNPDNCRIRVMTAADLDRVVAMEAQLQSHPWRRAHFENCLAIGNLALVVEMEEAVEMEELAELEEVVKQDEALKIQQPVITQVKATQPVLAFAVVSLGAGEAELLNVGVDPAFQRQGIAERFLSEILTLVKAEADTIFLEVRTSNQPAIALYEKLGFNQVGVRPNYYPSVKGREDALLYAMSLL